MYLQGIMKTEDDVWADLPQVQLAPTPPSTLTHYPIPHSAAIDIAKDNIDRCGMQTRDEKYILSNNNNQMFGLMEVTPPGIQAPSVIWEANNLGHHEEGFKLKEETFTFVLRNSHDKSFPLTYGAGFMTFVCANMCLIAEEKWSRKHTRHILRDMHVEVPGLIAKAIGKMAIIEQFLDRAREFTIKPMQGDALIVETARRGILPPSKVMNVANEWRVPSYSYKCDDFSIYQLLQAYTATAFRPETPRQLHTNAMRTPELTGFYLKYLEDKMGDSLESVY